MILKVFSNFDKSVILFMTAQSALVLPSAPKFHGKQFDQGSKGRANAHAKSLHTYVGGSFNNFSFIFFSLFSNEK